MDREYDLFEKFPDGSVQWRGFVAGLEAARAKLQLLAKQSENEIFAMHAPTKEIAARVNAKENQQPSN